MKASIVPVAVLVVVSSASLIPYRPNQVAHFAQLNSRDDILNLHAPIRRQLTTPLLPTTSAAATTKPVETPPAQETSTTTSSTPTSISTPPTISTPTTTPVSQPTSTLPPTESSVPPENTASSQTTAAPPANTQQSAPPAADTPVLTRFTSTDEQGGIITVVHTVTGSSSPTSSSAAPSSTAEADNSGIGAKSIAGMAVAGGLFVIGLGGFIWWKLSKKRFAGFDNDDGDAIKWPELKDANAMHPLPIRSQNTGTLDGPGEFDSRLDGQSIKTSPYAYDTQSVVSSTADLTRAPMDYASHDAFAAPPPGAQPYSDEPGNRTSYGQSQEVPQTGYYDPYRGPIPNSLDGHPATAGYGMEGGRRSPGPGVALGGGIPRSGSPAVSMNRAPSPGPNAAYAPRSGSPGPNMAYAPRSTSPGPNMAYAPRSTSPGPNMAYAPRSNSPGPNAALGMGRSTSPGPNMAYGVPPPGARAQSPGPNMAYGAPRSQSPGPNMAYGPPQPRSQSPGPNVAYGGGQPRSQSPGPNAAYGDAR